MFSFILEKCPEVNWWVTWSLFTRSAASSSLQPQGLQHARLPCLSECAQTHVHSVNDANQQSNPLLPPSPPALNLSQHQGLFQRFDALYWSLNFSISHSNEYSGLIAFRLDLLAVQGTLKSRLQHHSSKAPNSSVLHLLYGPTLIPTHTWLL